MRTFTAASTSSGAAPRYWTSTLMLSSSISGNTSSLLLTAARTPLNRMNAIIRLAATALRASQSIMPFTAPPRGASNDGSPRPVQATGGVVKPA